MHRKDMKFDIQNIASHDPLPAKCMLLIDNVIIHFINLKKALTNAHILAFPTEFDQFILDCIFF
jgi:hypothetical protein